MRRLALSGQFGVLLSSGDVIGLTVAFVSVCLLPEGACPDQTIINGRRKRLVSCSFEGHCNCKIERLESSVAARLYGTKKEEVVRY